MKSALVTGSAGFVGRHMVAELRARGWDVGMCDPAHSSAPGDDALYVFREHHRRRYDLVVHCAARSPHRAAIDGQPSIMVYNLMLDAAMFDWALRTAQSRVLYLSSSAVYPVGLQDDGWQRRLAERDVFDGVPDIVVEQIGGDGLLPDASYGWTKLTGEKLAVAAVAAGLAVHVVRPFSGYGADQGIDWPFGAFVARARRREDPFTIWGTGEQVRDWIHIDDVVAGALAVVEADVRVPVNLCTGRGTSMLELAAMICDQAAYRPHFELLTGAPAGVAYRVGDPARLSDIYTLRVSLEEGVAQALT